MSTDRTVLSEKDQADRDALLGRMNSSAIGALELLHVYLGERLGLYEVLRNGPTTPAALAGATGINERYAREWLEQQAVAGYLHVEPGADGDDGRRYGLLPGHAEVLTDSDSVNFLAPIAAAIVGIGGVMSEVVEAFRTGAGIPYRAYGDDMRGAIARLNRPMFINLLGNEWFPRSLTWTGVFARHLRLAWRTSAVEQVGRPSASRWLIRQSRSTVSTSTRTR